MRDAREVAAEARNLRRAPTATAPSDRRMDERKLMMDIIRTLPPGRAWNDEHLEMVKDLSNNWAPFVALRKFLIEAGIRAQGPRVLLTEQEKELWYRYPEDLAGAHGPEAETRAREEGSGISPLVLY
jgi:hypothetical protein